MAFYHSLVLKHQHHLKWPALDPLEALLMALSCICILGFTASVFFDVLTRELHAPWLWLQEVTTGFFAYGVFIGMALATRRNDHMYLSEIVARFQGRSRLSIEVFGRIVVLVVALCMIGFGYQNFLTDLGSFRMPSLIPLGYYTIIIPISGALIALFTVEQLVNGMKNGFAALETAPEVGDE
jgi:TRAP-type C4-dicarboxylate transport system permease small subunit